MKINKITEQTTQKYYQRIEKRLRSSAMLGLIVILLTALLLLLVSRKSAEVQSAHKLVAQSARLTEDKTRSQDLLVKYQDESVQIRALYPNERTIVIFVQRMEDIGNLSAEDFSFSFDSEIPKKDEHKYPYLSYTLRMTTDLNGLLVFLDRFERLPYLTTLRLIQGQNLGGFDGKGSYVLKADVYIAEPFSS